MIIKPKEIRVLLIDNCEIKTKSIFSTTSRQYAYCLKKIYVVAQDGQIIYKLYL